MLIIQGMAIRLEVAEHTQKNPYPDQERIRNATFS